MYKEGILLEVMDKDAIIEEMKVDRIRVNNQTTANDLIKQRLSWNPANSESEVKPRCCVIVSFSTLPRKKYVRTNSVELFLQCKKAILGSVHREVPALST